MIIGNVAGLYSAVGRHADALAMGGKAIEFFRRIRSENHPDIGECDARIVVRCLHLADGDSIF
jgi:hypothetical protein